MLKTTLPGSGFLNSPEEHFPWFGHPWQPVAKPAWAEVGPTQATHYHYSFFSNTCICIWYICIIHYFKLLNKNSSKKTFFSS